MENSEVIESFIREEVVNSNLSLHKPVAFRTHVQLYLDAAVHRGWTVERIGKSFYAFYDSDRFVGVLQQMITSLTSSVAVSICARKDIARLFFKKNNVAIAEGESFLSDELPEAISYFESVGKPVVVKPSRGAAGKGISMNVTADGRFRAAWEEALAAQAGKGTVVVEQQVPGIDIRVFVVGGKVVAASTRLPAFVVGDGRTSLSGLIQEKQQERSQSAYLKRMPIAVDFEWLDAQGLQPDSIIENSKIVILNMAFNIHQGGTNLDLTGKISTSIENLARAAAESVPGLEVAGVDLMVQSLESAEGAVVLEANTSANIAVHHYPGYGEPRLVADSVLDLLEIRRTESA